MKSYTEVFVSNIPFDQFDDVKRSFWDIYLPKVGGKKAFNEDGQLKTAFKAKLDAFPYEGFPGGPEIIADTTLECAQTIVTVSGPDKNLLSNFLHNLSRRDNGPVKRRCKRFWSFPTSVLNAALIQYAHGHVFSELRRLYNERSTPAEFEAVFDRFKPRMMRKQRQFAIDWYAKRDQPNAHDAYMRWHLLHRVTTTDLEEFIALVNKVLNNEVL